MALAGSWPTVRDLVRGGEGTVDFVSSIVYLAFVAGYLLVLAWLVWMHHRLPHTRDTKRLYVHLEQLIRSLPRDARLVTPDDRFILATSVSGGGLFVIRVDRHAIELPTEFEMGYLQDEIFVLAPEWPYVHRRVVASRTRRSEDGHPEVVGEPEGKSHHYRSMLLTLRTGAGVATDEELRELVEHLETAKVETD